MAGKNFVSANSRGLGGSGGGWWETDMMTSPEKKKRKEKNRLRATYVN